MQKHSFESCCAAAEPGNVLRLLIIAYYTHMEPELRVTACMCARETLMYTFLT